MSLKKLVRYFRKPKVYDVSELAESFRIDDELEKTFWELKKMGLTDKEIREAIDSLKKRES